MSKYNRPNRKHGNFDFESSHGLFRRAYYPRNGHNGSGDGLKCPGPNSRAASLDQNLCLNFWRFIEEINSVPRSAYPGT